MARATSANFRRIFSVRIWTKFSFDIESLRPLESVYFDYPDSAPLLRCCGSGPSPAEQAAQQQAATESQTLLNDFNQQFGQENSFVQNFLTPTLMNLYTNPQGYGAQTIADEIANLTNVTGAQAANAKQQSQQQFATFNMAGLPSGVENVIQSQISSAAGNTIAQGTNAINLANNQAKFIQQQEALKGLQGLPGAMLASPQVGGLLTGANQNAFNQANTINQQSIAGDFWGNLGQGLLGGLINGAAGYLTGGLTTLGQMGGGGGLGGVLFGQAGGGAGSGSMGAPVATSQLPNVIT